MMTAALVMGCVALVINLATLPLSIKNLRDTLREE